MTELQLKQIAGYATTTNVKTFLPFLNSYMNQYNINTKYRIAAFLAQVIHESGSFKYTREIASGRAYEGRKDLGNIQVGDGERFRGRGLIQITGRTNYELVSKGLNEDFVSAPEKLEEPCYATKSACWWWNNKGLNEIADNLDTVNATDQNNVFKQITRKVNGGLNGLKDREYWFDRALKIL